MKSLLAVLCYFLAGVASGATVSLAWDAPSDVTGITGYRVAYGTQSGAYTQTLDAGNSLAATVAGLADGATYYFAAQSYGNASDSVYSNEVSATTPGAPPPPPSGESIFAAQTPALVNENDGVPYEFGVRFMSSVDGQITAIRFWKDSLDTGSHVGRLWNATGAQLTSVAFGAETASGWQTQSLATPISIVANTEYMVTVNSGYYVDTVSGLASSVINGHLSTIIGMNGRYGPVGQYPTSSWNDSNYFRDVVFVPGGSPPPPPPPPSDTTPPVVAITSPASGAVLKGKGTVTVSASSTDDVGVVSMTITIDGAIKATGNIGSLSYVWNIRNVPAGSHAISVTAKDAAGNSTTKSITVTRQ